MSLRTLTRVRAALDRLDVADRALMSLLLVERLSPAEAAGALQCPRAQVERHSREILEQLRREQTPARNARSAA